LKTNFLLKYSIEVESICRAARQLCNPSGIKRRKSLIRRVRLALRGKAARRRGVILLVPRLLPGHASSSRQSYRVARSEARLTAGKTADGRLSPASTPGQPANDRFIPTAHRKTPRNKTEFDLFCTTSHRAYWSHRGNAAAEEPRAL